MRRNLVRNLVRNLALWPFRSAAPRAWVLGASLGVLAACQRDADRPPPTSPVTVRGAEIGSASNDDAVMRVATARCERELACSKIGPGRAFEDQPSCLAQMGELMDEEAGRTTCPLGVDRVAVSSCLLEIQRTECGGELEHETNLPSCTKKELCLR